MKNSRGNSRRARVVAWIAVAAVAVTAFASLGGVGLAQSAIGLHQYQYGKKVTICHKGKKSIHISTRAWIAHKRHGDALGACNWKKRFRHDKQDKHAKHGQRWKKDKGARSDAAKTLKADAAKTSKVGHATKLKTGADVSHPDVSDVATEASTGRDGKGGGKDGKGKGEGRGHGKGGDKR